MYRYAAMACFSFCAVLTAAYYFGAAAIAAAALLLLFPLILRRHGRVLLRCLLCGFLAAALVFAGYSLRLQNAEALVGKELPFEGVVLQNSRYSAHRYTVYADLGDTKEIIEVQNYLDGESVPLAGDMTAGTVLITAAEAEPDHLLLSRGAVLQGRQLSAERPSSRGGVLSSMISLRQKAITALSSLGEGDGAALVLGMLTAETAELSAELSTAFSVSGIRHLLAVSGLHLSILIAVLSRLFDLCFVSPRRQFTLSLLCCLMMAILAGFSASVLRAAIMTGFVLMARSRGRSSDGLTSLGVAMALLLMLNPAAAASLSFWLSCSATLGILLLAEPITALIPIPEDRRGLSLLWQSAAVSLAAQIGTLPIVALSFGYLPTYSLLTNLLVLPLGYLVLIGGLCSLLLAALGIGASLPFLLAESSANLIAAIARLIAHLPGAVMPFHHPLQMLPVLAALFLLLPLLLLRGRKRLIASSVAAVLLAAVLIITLPYTAADTLITDEATGSVLIQTESGTLLLEGTESAYDISSLNRMLQKCGSPAVTVLLHHPQGASSAQPLRLWRQFAPQVLFCDAADELLADGVKAIPFSVGESITAAGFTVTALTDDMTLITFGSEKVLKCWQGYGIITEKEIPDDVTVVISHDGRLWQREQRFPAFTHSGNTTLIFTEGV